VPNRTDSEEGRRSKDEGRRSQRRPRRGSGPRSQCSVPSSLSRRSFRLSFAVLVPSVALNFVASPCPVPTIPVLHESSLGRIHAGEQVRREKKEKDAKSVFSCSTWLLSTTFKCRLFHPCGPLSRATYASGEKQRNTEIIRSRGELVACARARGA
jgi:hypothetical protein